MTPSTTPKPPAPKARAPATPQPGRTTEGPATSQRPITLALSDVGEVVFLPALLKSLRQHAPQASVSAVSLPAAEIANGLEAGAVDLAACTRSDDQSLSRTVLGAAGGDAHLDGVVTLGGRHAEL